MAERFLNTDFKRIGRSGPTVDGRVIDKDMIDQMAESYDKSLFTALIWPDHQRYANYGSVEMLRAEDNDEGGRDLFAVLSPNSFYIASNMYGQKLFTSMEVIPDFRKSGKAYLGGLGATDDPASAATSEIRFSKLADQGGMILTQNVEAIDKTFTDTIQLSLIDQLLEKFSIKPKEDNDMADQAALEQLKREFAALKDLVASLKPAEPEQEISDDQYAGLNERLEALETKFKEWHPDDQYTGIKIQLDTLMAKLYEALGEQEGTAAGEHFNTEDDLSKYI